MGVGGRLWACVILGRYGSCTTGFFSPPLGQTKLPGPPGEGGSTAVAVVRQQEVWGEDRLSVPQTEVPSFFYLALVFSPLPLPSTDVGQGALGRSGKNSLEF